MQTLRIFAEGDLSAYLEQRRGMLRCEIQNEDKNKLLNVNEDDYVTYLVEKYCVGPLVIDFDNVSVSSEEKMIPAEWFSARFNVEAGKRYPRQVITYHLPFSGIPELLRLKSSTRLMWSRDVDLSSSSISFDVINWHDDASQIKREAEHDLKSIGAQCAYVNADIEAFDNSIRTTTRQLVQVRKQQHLKQSNLLAELGVPVRRAANVPETFAIPAIRKKVVVKPAASDAPFSPDPVLDDSLHLDILRICRDAGREMERLPSIYAGKKEETLRDHFIMVLSPHFESVTGETFNKAGKTDIVIRHEKANVFVAECKFWRGAKSLHDAVDQILSYLTWRDSKAAVLCFVRTQDFSEVLQQVPVVLTTHSCFKRSKPQNDEACFNFDFALPTDVSRAIRLAVLCFHFPPLEAEKRS
jgi:hypothetical protein